MNNINNDPYNMASKSIDELLRIIAGRTPDTLDHQYAKLEFEKRKMSMAQNVRINESANISDSELNSWEKALRAIAIRVVVVVLGACMIWVINHYLNLSLK